MWTPASPDGEPFVRVATVNGSFAADVLAARLADEGFDVRISGDRHALYPVNIGEMALYEVFVPNDQVDEAAYVLLVNAVDDVLDETPEEQQRSSMHPARLRHRCVAALLLAMALAPLWHVVG